MCECVKSTHEGIQRAFDLISKSKLIQTLHIYTQTLHFEHEITSKSTLKVELQNQNHIKNNSTPNLKLKTVQFTFIKKN